MQLTSNIEIQLYNECAHSIEKKIDVDVFDKWLMKTYGAQLFMGQEYLSVRFQHEKDKEIFILKFT